MAAPSPRLVNAAVTGINISSAAAFYAYTAPGTLKLGFEVWLSNAAGNGNYTYYLRKQKGGTGSNYTVLGKQTVAAALGETTIGFTIAPFWLFAGDILQIMILGQGGDISVNGSVEVFNDGQAAANAVWDEVLTTATHNVVSSAGRRLRNSNSFAIVDGQIDSATTQTVVLGAEASALANAYDQNLVVITSGTGAGQARMVMEYATDRTAIVDRVWETIPLAGDSYQVMAFSGILLATHGIAQSGASATITLATSALNIVDSYVGCDIYLSAGTGAGQTRLITAYTTGRIATVSPAWDTQPDNTTVYKVIPAGRSITETSNDKTGYSLSASGVQAIWDALTSALTAVGSIGKRLADDIDNKISTVISALATFTAARGGTMAGYIYIKRGDTIAQSISGLGDLTGYVTVDFTLKTSVSDDDAAAILRIRKNASGLSDGLITLNGASGVSVTATDGSLTMPADLTTGVITVNLIAADTKQLAASSSLVWDIQVIKATSITTPANGTGVVTADVTRLVV